MGGNVCPAGGIGDLETFFGFAGLGLGVGTVGMGHVVCDIGLWTNYLFSLVSSW